MSRVVRHNGMGIEDYHATHHVSRSAATVYRVNPQRYYEQFVAKTYEPRKASDAMQFGTAIDMWLTEGKLPDEGLPPGRVAMPEGMIKRGAKWEEFSAKHDGKDIISHHQHMTFVQKQTERLDAIRCIDRNISAHAMAKRINDDPHRVVQASFFVDDEWKCRPDIIIPGWGIVDIKTTMDSRAKEIVRSCVTYGYHIQGAMCQKAWQLHTGDTLPFVLLCIENTEPYTVECYQLDDAFLAAGLEAFERALAAIKRKEWTRPSHGKIVLLDKPGYLDYEAEYEVEAM